MRPISDTIADLLGNPDAVVHGNCPTHGAYEHPYVSREGREPPEAICLACVTEEHDRKRAAADEAEAAERRERLRRKRLDAIGLPLRTSVEHRKPFDPPTPRAAQNLEACREYANDWPNVWESGRNLVLTGRPGTGKTHLAAVICEHVANVHEQQPRYVTAARLLRHIRGSYQRDADYTEAEAIARFTGAALLVIDEIGVKLASDSDRALLFEVIDERYQDLRPTIVISNLGIGEIAQHTDERLVDRLAENGTVLVFDWASRRGGSPA